MTDVVIDLETLGTRPGSAILSIGAVAHIPGAPEDEKEEFYATSSLASSLDLGLGIDADTVLWWMRQEDSVRREAFSGTMPLAEVLGDLKTWLESVDSVGGIDLYGKGPSFDCSILAEGYSRLGMESPWRFARERCVRTVLAEASHLLGEEDERELAAIRSEVPHHALWDARAEMRALIECRWRVARSLAGWT